MHFVCTWVAAMSDPLNGGRIDHANSGWGGIKNELTKLGARQTEHVLIRSVFRGLKGALRAKGLSKYALTPASVQLNLN